MSNESCIIKSILMSFGTPNAKKSFIDTIASVRDSFDGVSAAHWTAWNRLFHEAKMISENLEADDR